MAIEIDKDGRMVKVENGVTTYVPTGQQQQWQAAVQAAMQRNGTTDPSHSRFIVVEQGDSIWSITHQVGSPFGEATDKNRFANDDLIYAGQVIEVPEPAPEDAGALGIEGVDAFAQGLNSRADHAEAADSSTAGTEWDGIKTDIGSYLDSVPPDQFIDTAYALIGHPDFTEETQYTRTLAIESYLDRLGDVKTPQGKQLQQQAVSQLLNRDWPYNAEDIRKDVLSVADERGLVDNKTVRIPAN
jgi:LysM repeat protein